MGREGSQFSIPSCRFRREMAARAPLAPRQQRFKVNRDGAVVQWNGFIICASVAIITQLLLLLL